MHSWEFAGWGVSKKIIDLKVDKSLIQPLPHKLGEWKATAICGNDITSSCLYVSALSIMVAGVYAPIALLMVSGLLYLFRKIYGEVGSALPLNGGTYTALLNTTNKKFAAAAACLTLLSYIATAVISANEAMHYLHQILPSLPIIAATVFLLGLFALLNILGISESANVALAIFIFHILTLVCLIGFSFYFILENPNIGIANWNLRAQIAPDPWRALYLGFAAAMLGISGFESSANFIEEQKEGVFPKTLKNMWIAVSIFNPLLCLLALGIVSTSEISMHSTNLLSHMALMSSGEILKTIVSIDAVLVLSGAVLTSYVGVVGLVKRMSLDRCLPALFLSENKWRKTNHWIISGFFILCTLILFITHGDVKSLAGVYTLSFLCVMALFAIGNLLLKAKRGRLPRLERANVLSVLIAFFGILIGLSGNLVEENIIIFLQFLMVVFGTVLIMLYRIQLLSLILVAIDNIINTIGQTGTKLQQLIHKNIEEINSQEVVFFTKEDDLPTLNSAALYVLENELTSKMTVVYVYKKEEEIPPVLAEHLKTIDHIYPKLRINFLAILGDFSPQLIEEVSIRLKIPKNFMFIGTPGDHFPYQISQLGGVRIILG